MTIVRVGATKKYAAGWESIFTKGSKKKAAAGAPTPAVAKKSPPKGKAKAGKKAAAKKTKSK